jgi:long-chain acyl-CoA synthetase
MYIDKPWVRHYDKHVPESMKPYTIMSVPELFDRAVEAHPGSPFCVTAPRYPKDASEAKEYTYKEIGDLSDQLAAGLVKLGLKKGDPVGLDFVNAPQFAIAFFGILKAGGVVAAINPHFPPQRKADQLNKSGVEILIMMARNYESINAVRETTLKHIIVSRLDEYYPKSMTDDNSADLALSQNDFWLQQILEAHSGDPRPKVEIDPEVDAAVYQGTGGTTGIPKIVYGTHAPLTINPFQIRTWYEDPDPDLPPDSLLCVIPLYHIFAIVCILLYAVVLGAPIIMIPDARDTNNIIAHFAAFRPTIFMAVPALFNTISRHEDIVSGRVNLHSLRFCLSGASPLAPEDKRRFESFTSCPLLEGYGSTETLSAVILNPLRRGKEESIGTPIPDVECRIVSLEDGETEMPVGEPGELVLRGPYLMTRYNNNPEETANTLRNGWLHTGDVAIMDEEGYFSIIDRKKDVILVGGFNVYPNLIEKVLLDHEAVADAAVAGIPNPKLPKEEIPKAWIVLAPGQEATAEELVEHCRTYLARYEVPREVVFVERLPKTPVGKILRRELVR